MWRRVGLIQADVLEECVAFIFKVEEIYASEEKCRRFTNRNVGFLQDPHGATSKKTALFIVTTVKTSNPTHE
jgi:hypothetical protein